MRPAIITKKLPATKLAPHGKVMAQCRYQDRDWQETVTIKPDYCPHMIAAKALALKMEWGDVMLVRGPYKSGYAIVAVEQ